MTHKFFFNSFDIFNTFFGNFGPDQFFKIIISNIYDIPPFSKPEILSVSRCFTAFSPAHSPPSA